MSSLTDINAGILKRVFFAENEKSSGVKENLSPLFFGVVSGGIVCVVLSSDGAQWTLNLVYK